MSRDPSRTQRAILAALRENVDGLTAAQLARHVWGHRALDTPSHGQQETIRRALLNLQRQGLADTFCIRAEPTPGGIRLHTAATITAAGFDLAGQLGHRPSPA